MDPSRADMKICRQAYLFTLGLLCVPVCLHSEKAGSWVHFNENRDKQIGKQEENECTAAEAHAL